ncbi:MAG TPA: right-handed parallel beta-helix repeat-containing protein, partial [Candidatus Omnitrophota bacterium]|nr:right-handed parallel beta-helix repeat-containing protein [Candidatus Omnitrophota bacterium]
MRRSNNVRFSQIAVIGFILSILGSAMPQTSHADLVDDGKQMLLEENDLYGAAAKFDEALAASPSDGRANFWQALTLIWTNPDLKGTFLDLEVFGENDTDPESDLLILDEVDHEKYQPTGIDAIILDNSDSGYTEPGTGWYDPDPTVESSYRENCRVHSAGTGTNTAAWEMAVPVDGYYNVHVWVANIGNNTQNQHYSVTHDTGTSTVDKWWGTYDSWKTLGRFKFTTGQPARIELSDLTYSTGSIVADAVKLEYDGDEFDDMLAGATGTWVSYGNTNAIGGTYREIAYGNTGTLTWAPYIPNDGKYQIYAFYQSAGDSATNASYSITPAGGTATTIVVDQQREGFTRVSLGLFDLKAGMGNTIVLSSSGANGKVTADAIRIVPMRTFPTAAQIQGNLTSTITQINTALSCLDAIGTGFADTVDLGMKDASGNPMMTELDYGDVLMFKATMNMIKHNFNLIGAYDFSTIDPNQVACSYNIIINDVFDYYTSLATLRPDGASCLADAKSAFQESIEQYFNAYDVIINESDDQTADLIVFDQGYIERDVDALHPLLTDILNNLNGNIPSVQFDTDQLFEQLEMDDTYQAFNINLRSLYDDPKQLRDLRPQFDDENHIIRSSFPDPTFDGLLPDMTEEELNGILHKGPELEHIDIIWNGDVPNVDLSWTTDTYDDFTRYALFRAEDGNVTESSIKVYESTNKNITTCTDTTLNPDQRTYYYRLYTYYSNGDKSATNVRKAVTSVYVNISATGTEDGSKEDPYNTLNEAVDAAVNGAKIRVAAGAYPCSDRELGMWDKGNLKFEGGYEPVHWTRDYEANETILDGTGQDGWSTISFNRATGGGIDGFTVTGAFMSDGACGIQISQATDVIIRNCKIISNRRGIGVWDHSSCVIENCSIENNVTDGIGTDASSAVIRETAIAHNQQSAINAYSYSSIDISDSQIFDNCVTGGTIYFIVHIGNHSNLNVTRTSVYQNNNTGAGLAVRDYGTFSIRDSQIYNNGGRAVEIYMASGDLTNTLVANNALDGIS